MEKRTITAADIKVGDHIYIVANNQMKPVTVQSISDDTNGKFFDITLTDCVEIMKLVNDTQHVSNMFKTFRFFYASPEEDNCTDIMVLCENECGYIDEISAYTDPAIAYQNLRTMCLSTLETLKKKYNVK